MVRHLQSQPSHKRHKFMDARKYQPEIDALRAIAVVMVVLFHLDLPKIEGGYVGVDIFFVISGYLISRIIANQAAQGDFSYGQFYLRRIRRLAPALMFTVVVTHIGGFLLLSPQFFQIYGQSAISALFSFSNIHFWLESDYFATESEFKPLLHTWSLSVEEQVYLIWPALLLFLHRRFRQALPTMALIGIGVASLASAEYMLSQDAAAAFFLTPFRLVEFCLGAALLRLPSPHTLSNRSKEMLLGLGYICILVAAFAFEPDTRFPGLHSLVPCIGACLVIHAGTARYLGAPLRIKLAVYTGLISYSFYLAHWPLIAFYKYITLSPISYVEAAALFGASFAFAAGMHRYIETPFRYPATGSAAARNRQFVKAIAAIAIMLAIPAALVWDSNGWTWRLGDKADQFRNLPEYEKVASVISPRNFHRQFYGGVGCKNFKCEYGAENSGRPLYVIGDSHARALYQGLITTFPERHIVLYSWSGCDFFSLRYMSPNIDRKFQQCADARNAAHQEIAEKNADVILTQRWESYRQRQRIMHIETGEERPFTSDEDYARFVAKETSHFIRNQRYHKLLLIGAVPEFSESGSPMDCLQRPYFSPSICHSTARNQEPVASIDAFEHIMRNNLPQDTPYLSVFDVLCDEMACTNMINGAPVYSDKNHLSIWGARHVSGHYADVMRAYFNESDNDATARQP